MLGRAVRPVERVRVGIFDLARVIPPGIVLSPHDMTTVVGLTATMAKSSASSAWNSPVGSSSKVIPRTTPFSHPAHEGYWRLYPGLTLHRGRRASWSSARWTTRGSRSRSRRDRPGDRRWRRSGRRVARRHRAASNGAVPNQSNVGPILHSMKTGRRPIAFNSPAPSRPSRRVSKPARCAG